MLTTTHILSGLLLGKYIGHTGAIMLGTLIIDMDHIYFIFKYGTKHGLAKTFKTMFMSSYEEDESRTFFHSLLGWLIISSIFYILNPVFGLYFGIGYLLHLFLDALDTTNLILFYPQKYNVIGPIEFNSLIEYLFAIGMFIAYLFF